jgi:hypothetical protein
MVFMFSRAMALVGSTRIQSGIAFACSASSARLMGPGLGGVRRERSITWGAQVGGTGASARPSRAAVATSWVWRAQLLHHAESRRRSATRWE